MLAASLLLPRKWMLAVLGFLFIVGLPLDAALDNTHEQGDEISVYSFLALIACLGLVITARFDKDLRDLWEANAALSSAKATIEKQSNDRISTLQQLAHDLSSPLTPVMLNLAALRMQGTDDARRRLDMMERNLKRQQRLIQDVRDLARLDGGQLAMHRERTDIANILHEAVEAVSDHAAQQSVKIELEAPSDLPVHADPGRIRQVTVNLLSNAIKFSPPESTIRVAALGTSAQVTVRVADQGPGMRVDQLANLFRPFTQVHDPRAIRRPEDKGSGLGLYISKGIVEAHGGSITAESAGPGHGSQFAFTLPRAPTEPSLQPQS